MSHRYAPSPADRAVPASTPTYQPADHLLATAAVTAAVAVTCVRLWWSATLPAFGSLAVGLAIAGVSDARTRRLPKRVVYPTWLALLAGLTLAADLQGVWTPLAHATLSGLALSALFAATNLASRKALAFGDVRLGLPIGTALGWYGARVTLVGLGLGFLLAGAATSVLLALARTERNAGVPLGGYLAVATLATIWALGPAVPTT
jgi:leader peptidase (prepilin peptidase) / N-methyltransferase